MMIAIKSNLCNNFLLNFEIFFSADLDINNENSKYTLGANSELSVWLSIITRALRLNMRIFLRTIESFSER